MPTDLPPRLMPFRSAVLRFVSTNAVRCAVIFVVMKAGCPGAGPSPATTQTKAAPVVWFTDTTSPVVPLYPANAQLPSEPLDGQERRRERCMQRVADYINGGCWIALRAPPPCVAGTFQHGNACYAPQTKSPDVPVSVAR